MSRLPLYTALLADTVWGASEGRVSLFTAKELEVIACCCVHTAEERLRVFQMLACGGSDEMLALVSENSQAFIAASSFQLNRLLPMPGARSDPTMAFLVGVACSA